jgi:predicted DCC family thiol-disulfide oxidoreductase YuxK
MDLVKSLPDAADVSDRSTIAVSEPSEMPPAGGMNISNPSLADVPAAGGRARPGRIAVIYDGECSLCRVSAEAVRVFDNSDAIDLIDLHDSDARAGFPALEFDALMDELHVVDDRGNVSRGARAVNEVLRHQRGLPGWLAYLWYLPGFAWLADRQYKRIAQSRYGARRPPHEHHT